MASPLCHLEASPNRPRWGGMPHIYSTTSGPGGCLAAGRRVAVAASVVFPNIYLFIYFCFILLIFEFPPTGQLQMSQHWAWT